VDPAAAGLLGAAIAGSVALTSAALARRTEHEKWLREKRLEAYAKFLTAVDELAIGAVLRTMVDDSITEAIQEQIADDQATAPEPTNPTQVRVTTEMATGIATRVRETVFDVWAPFQAVERSMALVKLVGPPELEARLVELKEAAFALGFGKKRDDGLNEFNDLFETFVRESRSYLHVKERRLTWPLGPSARRREPDPQRDTAPDP
jgi:hypothetical protein